MSIHVRFFASLSEELGFSETQIEYYFRLTIGGIWSDVADRPAPENLMCALNQEYAQLKHEVKDGDEVAFFPPVNGG